MKRLKGILLGDAMIGGEGFEKAWKKYLGWVEDIVVGNWETNWEKLQYRRLEVEKKGPEIEEVDPVIFHEGKDTAILIGLFIPVSSKVMDAMPDLKIIGVSRAGLENVNVEEATRRGILVFNIQGRNAHAVSVFAIGLMLAECRNIARAHLSIKNGQWRKSFCNSEVVPELGGRTVGIIGFGYIGKLVAKKLSGFDVNILVYDPYTSDEEIENAGAKRAGLDQLLKESDFVSLHARLTDKNKGMLGQKELSLMKPGAYLINTGRAGLLDQNALVQALKDKRIMGAALDVFSTEPIEKDNELLSLDNVTLTSHIAGTTADALANSPYLLIEDIAKFLNGEKARFIVNPEVLENPPFREWFQDLMKGL